MNLSERLKGKQVPKTPQRKEPLWEGPDGKGPNGGITYSLLCRFLNCRERFRIKVVEGLTVAEKFNPSMEYGNLWHCCEEALAGKQDWKQVLGKYADDLGAKFPFQREEVLHWYGLCRLQFPIYLDHWSKHPDVKDRTPLLQEQSFNVPYSLPSGRKVRLRGKWDSVDLIGKGKEVGIWIQENKTKSQLDPVKIQRQLSFDLQSMIYMVALELPEGLASFATNGRHPLKGIRYNVIRRSAHKSAMSFEKKILEDRADGRIGEWFGRWQVGISPRDIERFRKECLDPILEQLWDWWEWMRICQQNGGNVFANRLHWCHPFGVYNVLDEGGSTDLDHYLESGSTAGLTTATTLFPELQT